MAISANPALSRALEAELGRGPIPFPRFMELALYHPEGGYYCQPRSRIGREGDFQTSPHQSPWFGRMVARQLEALWADMGRPPSFPILEYGPGEGWLAHDIIEAIEAAAPPALAEALEYLLLERSPAAAGRIRKRLGRWLAGGSRAPRARLLGWPAGPSSPPEGFEGTILAHEFLDALPVHLLVSTEEGLRERYVERRGGRLSFCEGPLSDRRLEGWFEGLGLELQPGQVAEVCLAAKEWIEEVGSRLRRGAVLIFDYGYSSRVLYQAWRKEGTLRGYRRHAITGEVLERAGEVDLTAHVDFTTLLRGAEASGLTLAGFTDQCRFLLGLGLGEALEGEADAGGESRRERRSVMALLDPAGLGSAIKVMLLTRGIGQADFPAFVMRPEDRESLATLRG